MSDIMIHHMDEWQELPVWVILAMDALGNKVIPNWREAFWGVFIYGYDRHQSADVTVIVPGGLMTYSVYR